MDGSLRRLPEGPRPSSGSRVHVFRALPAHAGNGSGPARRVGHALHGTGNHEARTPDVARGRRSQRRPLIISESGITAGPQLTGLPGRDGPSHLGMRRVRHVLRTGRHGRSTGRINDGAGGGGFLGAGKDPNGGGACGRGIHSLHFGGHDQSRVASSTAGARTRSFPPRPTLWTPPDAR